MFDHYGKLLFIDLETTGVNPATDVITEIGIVEVSATGVERWSTLVNPERPLPLPVQRLTGISDAMVRHAPAFADVAPELLRRLEGALLIAHNARFDYGFLRHAFRRLGMTFRAETLCTVKLSRRLFPAEPKHNLDAIIARHGLHAAERHRALADADLLWQYWRKLERAVPAEAMHEAVRALLQKPALPAHLDADLLDDVPDGPGIYLFYGEHDVPLYIGRSSQLRARVMAHFASSRQSYKDAQLARQLRRIDWQETAGELGAALLEARLAHMLQPVHNLALLQDAQFCAWQLQPSPQGGLEPRLVCADDDDFDPDDGLYGLFQSPRKAQAALRGLAERDGLCPVLLGLEPGREAPPLPFTERSLHHCPACAGQGEQHGHGERLRAALRGMRLQPWPHAGAVAVIEAGTDGRQDIHVFDNWRHLGTARDEGGIWSLLEDAPARPAFDPETYRILSRVFAEGRFKVRPLTRSRAVRRQRGGTAQLAC
ncbi:DNA polymerase-3 subunit epsilon [Noviherbaspirillum humi]|uniref:DNA-directed DNA polymerase n=1 Tax=Noviherbaspirillum humi TaxID=1688639 RepID=A0A239KGH7_9BURK|nr:3'-5' exonuclease family protein [Noviherbaspirillum humi]SNT16244.1 DNA polymerase-3 subunit epsilon [Noviherbaspirillum humi]